MIDPLSVDCIKAFNKKKSDSLVEIRKDFKGWGLYARREIFRGTLVFRGTALQTYRDDGESIEDTNRWTNRASHTIQKDWKQHVIMDLPAILVNHSCNANLGIRENDVGAYDFYALRSIQTHEEVSWDYETAEYDIHGKFSCSCGAPNCRGELKGFRCHGDIVCALYGKVFIAPYLFRQPPQNMNHERFS